VSRQLRILQVEDSESDAALIVRLLEKAGFEVQSERVESEKEMRSALTMQVWSAIIADYSLPEFDAEEALRVLKESGLDLPFIVVSGSIGEEIAVRIMKAGAQDYLMKGDLARLAPAVERELREAKARQAHQRAEEARRESEERYRHLVESCNDWVWEVDQDGIYTYASPHCRDLLGYEPEEIIGKTPFDLMPPEEARRVSEVFAAIAADRRPFRGLENTNRHKNGHLVVLETNGAPVIDGQGRFMGYRGMDRDITQRKAHEREIERLNRLYAVLSEVNQAVVRASSRDQLLQEICRVAVETGGFKLAWIGRLDQQTQEVVPVARAGPAQEILRQVRVSAQGHLEGGCPIGLVARNGETGICRIGESDLPMPCSEVAREHGLVVCAGFPLYCGGQNYGALVLGSGDKGSFNAAERGLLKEVAMDVSYALDHFREEEKRRQAEGSLAEREQHLSTILRLCQDGLWLTDLEGRFMEVNDAACAIFGYSREEMLQMSIRDIETTESADEMAAHIERIMREGSDRFERQHRRKDGRCIDLEISVNFMNLGGGRLVSFLRDVTERKQIEKALLQRIELRDRLAKVAATVPGMIYSFRMRPDGSTCMPYASTALDEIYGLRPEEVVHDAAPVLSLIHPDDIGRVKESIADSARSMTPWRQEFRVCHTRKGELWVEGHSVPQPEPDEGIIWHGFIQDVTARREAEQALRESETRFRSYIEHAPAAVFAADREGRLVDFNPAALALLGYEANKLRSMRVWDLHPAEARGEVQRQLASLNERGLVEGEYRLTRQDGQSIWVLLRAVLLEDGRSMAYAQDITEHKLAELALRASEERFRAVVESAPDGIFVQTEGRFVYINGPAVRIFGATSSKELLGQLVLDRVHPEDRARAQERIRVLNQERRAVPLAQMRFLRVDGAGYDVEVVGVPFVHEGKGGALVFFRDVTDRRRLEDQFRQAQKMEGIGQLAGGVAHDFNNLLTTIMMQLELLNSSPNPDPQLRESIGELMAQAQRAASLTRQLLLFSRRSVMQSETLDLNEVVENLLKMLRRLIGENIKLNWHRGSRVARVTADGGMLEQLLMNFVVNARDAMPRGGLLTIATEVVDIDQEQARLNPQARPGRFVCLSVKDTGCGMSVEVLKRIFEPFFTTKEAGKGTGLGLATVYGIVSQHQGWITVESEVGKGSEFRVFLPLGAPAPARSSPKPGPESVSGGNETILLVEDDHAVRKTLGIFLRRWGYHVLEAANGIEAMNVWQQNQPRVKLLLTDMIMPEGMTGLELAERLRAAQPALKVIISSGYSLELAHRGASPIAGVRFVAKPCSPVELAKAVRQCLDKPGD